ncbi:hypothetical protein I6E81_10610 [Salinibacterium sp. NG22]|uniref:hypothetical protein n=1 Tax=Salinibacterium sp. NG22 TaxID=2792040 RepID=UPI0018CF2FB7|nr:hypothetical protein [Salinibacterium sp. NG22]MBH0110619.1 hypothetical protein [Salinibacterium sp. NG22]
MIRSFWKKHVKPPIPDETLDPFEGGVGVLTKDGVEAGHIASVVGHFVSPLSLFQQTWWVWYIVVWADGTHERSQEDYPPWITVRELQAGYFEFSGHKSSHNGRYDFAWLDADEAAATKEKLGITDEEF